MAIKKTLEQFLLDAKAAHGDRYDYSHVLYVNNRTKVAIICPKHGLFSQTPIQHTRGAGCKKCGRDLCADRIRVGQEEFIKRAGEKHNFKYDYKDVVYVNTDSKVTIICPTHGAFQQTPHGHLAGAGCKACSIDENADRKRKKPEQFIEESNLKHNNKYDYSKFIYTNTNGKGEIICPIHGSFFQAAGDHIYGHGCERCSYELRGDMSRHTFEMFVEASNKQHNNKYTYPQQEYISAETKMRIVCKKHGEFLQRAIDHTSGYGCPKCSTSISKKERAWLDQMGIPDTTSNRQVKIKIGNKKYNVDGYNPQTNTVYEFHGDYWHGNLNIYQPDELNKVTGKDMQHHYDETCRKHRDLKAAGYNLIWIWESDWKKQVAVQKMFKGAA